jgi:hypothetical protein
MASDHNQNEVEKRAIEAFMFLRRYAAVLTFFAAAIAAIIYGRQLSVMSDQQRIMQGQLKEATAARKDTEAQLRAFLKVTNPEMTPYDANGIWIKKDDPGITGWMVSPGWKNVGLSLAKHVRYGFDLKWQPEIGPETIEQLIGNCPDSPSLNDHPEFPGFTVAPGAENGFIAPQKSLPLWVAQAAQINQEVILFVINATYQDAFEDSPVHHAYACVGIFVNDPKKSAFSFVNLREDGD